MARAACFSASVAWTWPLMAPPSKIGPASAAATVQTAVGAVSRFDSAALTPAMTLSAPVSMVKKITAGAGVSYGHTWIAERDTNLALLPVGYADGVYRALGGRIDALINGRLRRSVGRICMDQFVVDLGPGEPDVAEGDEAILFGPGTSGELTAQDWADLLGTIHYEVVTSPRGRVVRSYREADAGGD